MASRDELFPVDGGQTPDDPTEEIREADGSGDRRGAGRRFADQFSFHGTVGEGGIGRVLMGFDETIGRKVAIKELKPPPGGEIDPRWVSRFLREAHVTGRLEHPSIVPVYHVGRKPDGMPYYVMRLVRGKTFSQVLRECQGDTPDDSLRLRLATLDRLIAVAEAMAYAHARGVIHRDLKPSNVVIGPFGETVILDWGLAKLAEDAVVTHYDTEPAPPDPDPDDDGTLTRMGEILGTPAYMAPEQVDPRFGAVDPATDVFALGCILYHILVGHPPLTGDSRRIIETLRGDQPLPSARRAAVRVPDELAAICDRALARDKDLRFAHAGQLADELRAFRDGRLVSTYAYSSRDLLRRFLARHRVPVITGVLALACVVVAAVVSVRYGFEAVRQRTAAEAAQARAEQALADVSDGADQAVAIAHEVAGELARGLDLLRKDMEAAGAKLAGGDPAAGGSVLPILQDLERRHQGLASFVVARRTAAGEVAFPETAGAAGIDWKTRLDAFSVGRVTRTGDGRWVVPIQVPIRRGGAVVGVLGAALNPVEMAAAFLDSRDWNGFRPWILQGDGVMVYSWRTHHIGDNLFEDKDFEAFPDIRLFGLKVLRRDLGVGVYRFPDFGDRMVVDKIAAWDVVDLGEDTVWKLVMVEDFPGDATPLPVSPSAPAPAAHP